jgi:hypothetical protein
VYLINYIQLKLKRVFRKTLCMLLYLFKYLLYLKLFVIKVVDLYTTCFTPNTKFFTTWHFCGNLIKLFGIHVK